MLKKKKITRFIAVGLVALLWGFAFPNAAMASGTFPDVNNPAIDRLAAEGIVNGLPDGKFHPNRPVTRAEAVTMVMRTIPVVSGEASAHFTDVPSSHFAYETISRAVSRGLVTGFPNGTFQPDTPLTRGQAAAVLARAHTMEPMQPAIKFFDVPTGHFAHGYIGKISSAGITVGFGDNTYRPDQNITRQEFAVLLARTIYPELRLEAPPPPPRQNPNTIAIARVSGTANLNIRSGPGTNHGIVDRFPRDTQVQVLDTVNNWARIDYKGGTAYASLDFLSVVSTTSKAPLRGRTIVVDPGHGGRDPGAVANGLRESDVVLDISLVLQRKLRMAGANVVMTRTTDVFPSLTQRINLANSSNAHAFVSVHANAAISTAAHGTETYWNRNFHSSNSQRLATNVQRRLVGQLRTHDRGVKQGSFRVIAETRVPSILVEVGFLTNRAEADKFRQSIYRQRSAEGIYRGLVDYFN